MDVFCLFFILEIMPELTDRHSFIETYHGGSVAEEVARAILIPEIAHWHHQLCKPIRGNEEVAPDASP